MAGGETRTSSAHRLGADAPDPRDGAFLRRVFSRLSGDGVKTWLFVNRGKASEVNAGLHSQGA